MAMIYESTPGGTNSWFRRYWEMSQGATKRLDFDAEYPISGIDSAELGSDRSEVFTIRPRCAGKSAAMKSFKEFEDELEDWAKLRLNLTMKTLPAVKVEVTPPPAPPPVSDTDRMWDLLVLAAHASRYGE